MKLVEPFDHGRIENVLKAHLSAAATKDIGLLRNSFTRHAFFVGTDDSEQWAIDGLASLLEGTKSGWDMTKCNWREIYSVTDGVAHFFETMVHEKYGPLRGSGVVVRGTDEEWRIDQYILSFSVPNKVVDKTDLLKLLAG